MYVSPFVFTLYSHFFFKLTLQINLSFVCLFVFVFSRFFGATISVRFPLFDQELQHHQVITKIVNVLMTYFPDVLLAWSTGRTEAAVTVFRTVQSLGLVLVFILDIYVTLLNLICVCAAVLTVGVILYLVLELVRSPLISTEPSPIAL